MAAQKCKKKKKKKIAGRKSLQFFQLIKIDNTLDSSRPYGRLLKNKKIRGSKELFLLENDC